VIILTLCELGICSTGIRLVETGTSARMSCMLLASEQLLHFSILCHVEEEILNMVYKQLYAI